MVVPDRLLVTAIRVVIRILRKVSGRVIVPKKVSRKHSLSTGEAVIESLFWLEIRCDVQGC
jgi:hypothetical protein